MVRGGPGAGAVRDAVRLALGTFTVLPVRPPTQVDRRTAGRAMVLAPVVGLILGVAGVAVLWLCRDASPLLAATLAVALLAVLTRGIHLDGLADTADGLGSGKPRDQALAVMRTGDIGPFGVVTSVLTLLVQVSALGSAATGPRGPSSLVVALVASRLVVPLVCSRGVPAARGDGLGSVVAGSVSLSGVVVAGALAAAALALGTLLDVLGDPAASLPLARPLWTLVSVTGPLLLAGLLAGRCVHRLGGVTGDVLGACVEVSFTASLVISSFG